MSEPYVEPPRQCARKHPYPSRSVAVKIARKQQCLTGKLNVYRCTFPRHVNGRLVSAHWHLGHPRPRKS